MSSGLTLVFFVRENSVLGCGKRMGVYLQRVEPHVALFLEEI